MTEEAALRFKKHIPPSEHVGWTVRYPLFEAASPQELADVALGGEAFTAAHPGTHLYPDPFLRRGISGREFFLEELVIVPGPTQESRDLAERVRGKALKRYGDHLRVESIEALEGGLLADLPLLLLGGSDTHPLCAKIAKKYQVGLFCNEHPGAGAWGITTHWELEPGLPPRYLLACDASTEEQAIGKFLETAVRGEIESRLCWVHEISTLPKALGLGGGFQKWIRQRHGWNPIFRDWFEGAEPPPSYGEFFLRWFQQDFPKYLPHNATLLDIGIDAVRFYQFTGDAGGLVLFREMLAGCGDLLALENPDIYISDLDFRLGTLCNYWNWVRHHPEIDPQESERVSQLLLGLTRMTVGYFENHWKHKPGPHNHQTFKARSMIQAWRFFGFCDGVPDREEWKTGADAVFAAIPQEGFKFRENATEYETFVPEHLLVWHEVTGVGISAARRSALVQVALREWRVRDSFLQPVEYGDAYPALHPKRPLPVSAWLCGDAEEEERLLAFECGPGRAFRFEFPSAIQSFQSLPAVVCVARELPAAETGWTIQKLDPLFARRFEISANPGAIFDKLAWRSGWEADSGYLLVEGIGKGNREPFVSHAHHETNSLLRLNLGGRIWLVNNGYGKKEGVTSARQAFNTRQIGPVDHNTLVIHNEAEGRIAEPPLNALVLQCTEFPCPAATTVLPNYGGVFWKRHIVIPHPKCVAFIDEVFPTTTATADSGEFEIQWNVLGERLSGRNAMETARFEQQGVELVFDHFGTGIAEWREGTSKCWRNLIQSGQYPYTQALPNHCIMKRTGGSSSEFPIVFVSGFWLDGVVLGSSWDSISRKFSLGLRDLFFAKGSAECALGRVSLVENQLEIQLSAPDLSK